MNRRRLIRAGVGAIISGSAHTLIAAEQTPLSVQWERYQYKVPNTYPDVLVRTKKYHRFSESTLERCVREEMHVFAQSEAAGYAKIVATNIANRVAKRYHGIMKQAAFDQKFPEPAMERSLEYAHSSLRNMQIYAGFIADELRRSGWFYQIEGLYHEGMDPHARNHAEQRFHLDCDLLCHVGMHCAFRHDINIVPVRVPNHMYLASSHFPDLAIDLTASERGFREPLRLHDGSTLPDVTTTSAYENAAMHNKFPNWRHQDFYKPLSKDGFERYLDIMYGTRH